MITAIRNRLDLYHDRLRYDRRQGGLTHDMSFTTAVSAWLDRNGLHAYMHHYLRHMAPQKIQQHRLYFSLNQRGFGEDALHGMWYTLLREFKPQKCLEIGVYRGQVVTLWGLIAKELGFSCTIHGISPFSPAGDAVSTYLTNLDYQQDVIASNNHFDLPALNLLKAYSTDAVAQEYIKSQTWDLLYIDGNHDYEVVLADYILCRDALAPGGLLVMDDSSLYTEFTPPRFSFAGHTGPSRVMREVAMKELRFLGGVGHNNVFQRV